MVVGILMQSLSPVVVMVHAQTPGVPQGGGKCRSEEDCSLGGLCNDGLCVCDAWFTGPTCALLNLQAQESRNAGTCGPHYDGYYSWGGRTLRDPEDGRHHLFASFMCRHNSLSKWTTESASAHFVAPADEPAGPYTWSPEQCKGDVCTPSIIPWSHNTVALIDPTAPKEERWQIWHVGDGIVDPNAWAPCFNSSEAGAGAGAGAGGAEAVTASSSASSSSTTALVGDDPGGDLKDGCGPSPPRPPPGPGQKTYVTYAPGPDGPWTRGLHNQGVPINSTGSWATWGMAGNPFPLPMPDGSMNLFFTAGPCCEGGCRTTNSIAMATSKNGWRGPFEMNAAPRPVAYPENEDPSVFRDPRGNYHLLTNVNTGHRRCAQGVECGGHAWSRDGIHFTNMTVGAFGPYITFSNGSAWANAYAERPLVTQDDNGVPLTFHVGLGRSTYTDSCNWVQLFCTGKSGEKCGPTLTPAGASSVQHVASSSSSLASERWRK